MRKMLTCLGVLLGLSTIAACTVPSQKEAAFATLVPISAMNDGLRLEISDIENFFETPSVYLLLANYSDDQIGFSCAGCGKRFFVYSETEGTWTEIGERGSSETQGEVILAPRGRGVQWYTIVNADPEISLSVEPVVVRIVVIGKILQGGVPTDREAGAYVDVTLSGRTVPAATTLP